MNVFLIPEMRDEIFKWCTNREKSRILRTNKQIYNSVDSNNRNTIREKAIFEYHRQFGNYLCVSHLIIQYMLQYVSSLLGKSHKLARWLYSMSEIFLAFKSPLDSIVCIQCPDELDATQCYYNNRKGKKYENIFKLLDLVSKEKRKRPVHLNELEVKLWCDFVKRLFEIIQKLKFLNDDQTYDLLRDSTRIFTKKQYKRFISFVNKWSMLTVDQQSLDNQIYIR